MPDGSQDLQNKIKDLTRRCQILEEINEETVKHLKKTLKFGKAKLSQQESKGEED